MKAYSEDLRKKIVEAVLPDYRTKFPKRTFTQPQLLAVLCLMGYRGLGPA